MRFLAHVDVSPLALARVGQEVARASWPSMYLGNLGGYVLRQLAWAAICATPATLLFLGASLSRANVGMSMQTENHTFPLKCRCSLYVQWSWGSSAMGSLSSTDIHASMQPWDPWRPVTVGPSNLPVRTLNTYPVSLKTLSRYNWKIIAFRLDAEEW